MIKNKIKKLIILINDNTKKSIVQVNNNPPVFYNEDKYETTKAFELLVRHEHEILGKIKK